jgi:hypothetical protein
MSSAQPERRACGSSPIATVGRSGSFRGAADRRAAREGRAGCRAAIAVRNARLPVLYQHETRRRRQQPRERSPPSVSDPSATTSARRPGHDPTVVADLAVADEPELLVGRKSGCREPVGHGTGVLRVSLEASPAQARDEIDRTGERRAGQALTPAPLTDVATSDPPVGRGSSDPFRTPRGS